MSVFANGSGTIDFKVIKADKSGWSISLRMRGDGRDVTFTGCTQADVQAIKMACTDFQKRLKEMKR